MKIEVKGRHVPVTAEVRELIERRFRKVAAQVSELALLEVEISEQANRAIPERHVATVTLHIKGVTLRAHDSARDLRHAINLCEEELARQVKRDREKRRHRREARAMRTPGAYDHGGLTA